MYRPDGDMVQPERYVSSIREVGRPFDNILNQRDGLKDAREYSSAIDAIYKSEDCGMSISDFYNTTVDVEYPSRLQNEMGGPKVSYSTRISDLKCRITPRSVTEADEFGKLTVRNIFRMYCDASATNRAMNEADRVSYGSEYYLITGIRNPALLDRHLEIDLEKIG